MADLMGTILYECRDLRFPTGGMRRLYRHVEILVHHGVDAAILHHDGRYRNPWFNSSAPIRYISDYQIASDDIVVLPEGHTELMRAYASERFRRFVIALNWSNIFCNLRVGETWQSFGISEVISGGPYEHYFVKEAMGIDSSLIRSSVDPTVFFPSSTKRLLVSCTPTKNSDVLQQIENVFRAKYPQFRHIPFLRIQNRPHHEVARLLSGSAIFLAHTSPEGFSRKTLEAMACGNIVVGFAGRGSLEMMKDRVNCLRVEDGDILGVASALANAVELYKGEKGKYLVNEAVCTARSYSPENEEQLVLEFWRAHMIQKTGTSVTTSID